MNIFKHIYILVFAFTLGCDTIEGDYIEQNAPFISDVYLFEFTGVNCPNCPDAHRLIEHLQEEFGDKLHLISVHAGSFAMPFTPDQPDFRTTIGDKLDERINKSKDYPSGSVMSIGEGTSILSTAWSTELAKYGWKRADVDIEFTMNIQQNELNVNIEAQLADDIEGTYKLCLYVTESKVVGFQVDGGSRIENYEHNHVLRASMNGVEGTDIKTGAIFDKTFKMLLNDNWNSSNLHVVPFVYNADTHQVLTANIKQNE